MLLEAFGFEEIYDYLAGKADWLASDLPAEATTVTRPMTGDLTRFAETCGLSEQAGAVAERLRDASQAVGIVVHSADIVVGQVELYQLERHQDRHIEDLMELGPKTFRPDTDPEAPLSFMKQHHTDQAIVTRPDGALLGLIERSAIEQVI